MGKLPIPFILLVGGFLLFEAFTMYKAKDRLEPLYIYDQFLSVNHAVNLCGSPETKQMQRFLGNLKSVRTRAAADLRKRDPAKTATEIDRLIDARSDDRKQEVDAIISANGCADPHIKTLLKRFEIQARPRLG